jgi:hypothetical protein
MPYIKTEVRNEIDAEIKDLSDKISQLHKSGGRDRDGMLNYAITKLLMQCYPSTSYKVHNEIIGMLECCKQEWYRKQVGPYEDVKELENGRVVKD